MQHYQIKVGDLLREVCIRKLVDGITEAHAQYYSVLDVCNSTLKVLPYAGSSIPIDSSVFSINDVKDEYNILIVKDCRETNVYEEYTNTAGYHGEEHVARLYYGFLPRMCNKR